MSPARPKLSVNMEIMIITNASVLYLKEKREKRKLITQQIL